MVWWGSRPARAPFQGGGNLLQADFDPASGQLAFCHSYTQSVKNFAAWHAAFPLSRRFTVNRDFAVNRSCDMQQILWSHEGMFGSMEPHSAGERPLRALKTGFPICSKSYGATRACLAPWSLTLQGGLGPYHHMMTKASALINKGVLWPNDENLPLDPCRGQVFVIRAQNAFAYKCHRLSAA